MMQHRPPVRSRPTARSQTASHPGMMRTAPTVPNCHQVCCSVTTYTESYCCYYLGVPFCFFAISRPVVLRVPDRAADRWLCSTRWRHRIGVSLSQPLSVCLFFSHSQPLSVIALLSPLSVSLAVSFSLSSSLSHRLSLSVSLSPSLSSSLSQPLSLIVSLSASLSQPPSQRLSHRLSLSVSFIVSLSGRHPTGRTTTWRSASMRRAHLLPPSRSIVGALV